MCGEQSRSGAGTSFLAGSPPRVRGTGLFSGWHGPGCGITPACAGNSGVREINGIIVKDHPRVCGEQGDPPNEFIPKAGSPPRVRGTVNRQKIPERVRRITPACAGNSHLRSQQAAEEKDHPRVCGEQWVALAKVMAAVGSPPRVRGTVLRKGGVVPHGRITPACAGNSCEIVFGQ